MLLPFLALTAAAEPAFTQTVALDKASDPLLSLQDGRTVLLDQEGVPWEAVDAWPAGTPLLYAYSEADGPVIIEPASGTRLLVVGVTSGAEHVIDLMEDDCLSRAVSTVDMVACSQAAVTAWEAQIERGYARLLASGSAEQRAAVQTSRQQWTTHRDAQLAMSAAYYATMDGTIVRLLAVSARRDLIKGHALQLWGLVVEAGQLQ